MKKKITKMTKTILSFALSAAMVIGLSGMTALAADTADSEPEVAVEAQTIVVKEQVNGFADTSFDYHICQITEANYKIKTIGGDNSDIHSAVAGADLFYTIYDTDTDEVLGTGTTDIDGSFSLEDGEYAVFTVEAGTDWYVRQDTPETYPLAEEDGVKAEGKNAFVVTSEEDIPYGIVQYEPVEESEPKAKGDKEALREAYEEALSLDESDYTAESWEPFAEALEKAKEVLDNEDATQEEVDEALAGLEEAREGLKKAESEPTQTVDKTALQDEYAEDVLLKDKESEYTPESWEAFEKALDKAEEVINDTAATQEEVDEALTNLQDAKKDLKEVEQADKTVLREEYDADSTLEESEYTPESWEPFADAMKQAKDVLDNEDATQEEVDAALADLVEAKDDLEKAESEPTPEPTPAAPTVTISSGLPDNQKTYDGAGITLTVEAEGSEGTTLSYQWYLYDEETEAFVPIDGATESTYTLAGNVSDSGQYMCTVTATDADGNDASTSAAVTIKIEKAAQEITFEKTLLNKTTDDEPFTNDLTIGDISPEDGAGITYVSSKEEIASVDPDTGEVTIHAAGTVTITATAAGTANYAEATASYVIEITGDESGQPTVNKDELREEYEADSELVESDYTPESWEPFEAAMEQAKAVLADEDATQEAVDEALKALRSAREGLEKVPGTEQPASIPIYINGDETDPLTYEAIDAAIDKVEKEETFTYGSNSVTAKFVKLSDLLGMGSEDYCSYTVTYLDNSTGDEAETAGLSFADTYLYKTDSGEYRTAIDGSAGRYWIYSPLAINVITNHIWGDVTWVWTGIDDDNIVSPANVTASPLWNGIVMLADEVVTATATRICEVCKKNETVEASSITHTSTATATKDGVTTYVATAIFSDGTGVTDTAEENTAAVDPEGYITFVNGDTSWTISNEEIDAAIEAAEAQTFTYTSRGSESSVTAKFVLLSDLTGITDFDSYTVTSTDGYTTRDLPTDTYLYWRDDDLCYRTAVNGGTGSQWTNDPATIEIIGAVEPTVSDVTITAEGGLDDDNTKPYDGGNVTLIATAATIEPENAEVTYEWYLVGEDDSKTLVQAASSDNTLVLEGNVSDSGTYECVVTATYSDVSVDASGTITVTIKQAAQDISYAQTTMEKYDYDEPFINKLTKGDAVYGEISYTIVQDDATRGTLVVEIEEKTGEVSICGGSGIAYIVATAAASADGNYAETSASYMLTVNADEIKWEIGSTQGDVKWDEDKGEYEDDLTYNGDPITLTLTLTLTAEEEEKLDGITYQWCRYTDTGLEEIENANESTLTLEGEDVSTGSYTYVCIARVSYSNGYEHTLYCPIEVVIAQPATKEAFAVYSRGDNSLTFYYGAVPTDGDTYNGKAATKVYTDVDSIDADSNNYTTVIPWYSSYHTSIKSVVFDESFKNAQPVSLAHWFNHCTSVTSVEGFKNVDTSKVTSMRNMFSNCTSLTGIDVSGLDTSSVTDMYGVFYYCTKLQHIDGLSKWDISSATDISYMFFTNTVLEDVGDLSGWDTSNVTTTQYMFYNCEPLKSVGDLSKWDMSNVTSISYMFRDCQSMESIEGLSKWDTSKVRSWAGVFYDCSGLKELDLSDWVVTTSDKANNLSMAGMFQNCGALTDVGDISDWNTAGVTNMSRMFCGCASLKSLDLSGWNTTVVKDVTDMFQGCASLESLDMSGWNTGNVTEDYRDFATTGEDSALQWIKIGDNFDLFTKSEDPLVSQQNWYDSNADGNLMSGNYMIGVTNENSGNESGQYWTHTTKVGSFAVYSEGEQSLTFYYGIAPDVGDTYDDKTVTAVYTDLETLNAESYEDIPWCDLGESVTSVVIDETFKDAQPTSFAYWFFEFSKASFSGFANVDTSKATSLDRMFAGCESLESIDTTDWNTSNVTDMGGIFYNCYALSSVDVSNWDTSHVTEMAGMFRWCKSLTELDVSNWDTSANTTLNSTFYGCSKLRALDVSNWITTNLVDLSYAFHECERLTTLDVSNWETTSLQYMWGVIGYCTYLTTVDMSGWNTSKVTDMDEVFDHCTNLTGMGDISGWDTSSAVYMDNTFDSCESLTTLDISGWDTRSVQYYDDFAIGCTELDWIKIGDNFDLFTKSGSALVSQKYWFDSDVNGKAMSENYMIGVSNATSGNESGQYWNYKAYAVYSETDYSLTFYWGHPPDQGEVYNGKTVTNIYKNLDSLIVYSSSYVPWHLVQNNIKSVVFDASFKSAQPVSLAFWFYGFGDVTFTGLENMDLSEVTSMESTFQATSITTLDLSGWTDTPKLTTMYNMFNGSASLTSVKGLEGLDTSGVTTMQNMFYNCTSLVSVEDLSNWDTANVTSMFYTFYNCEKLTYLDLSGWDTLKVKYSTNFARNCMSLEWVSLGANTDIFSRGQLVDLQYWYDSPVNGTQVSRSYLRDVATPGKYWSYTETS